MSELCYNSASDFDRFDPTRAAFELVKKQVRSND